MFHLSAHSLSNSRLPKTQEPLYPWLSRVVLVSTLTVCGVLSGISPQLVGPTVRLQSDSAAYAQSSSQITQYAKAAYDIEQLRQRQYARAKRIMGGNVPDDVCQRQNIPGAVRGICNDFLEKSADIIRQHGLTPSQFNDITRRKERDPGLRQQIEQELLRLAN